MTARVDETVGDPFHRALTALGFGGYLLIGMASVLMPSVMPALTQEYSAAGLSLAAIGWIFPARAIGAVAGNLLSGIGSDVQGRTRWVWLAAFSLSVALAVAALARPWLLFLGALALVGMAQGGISTGINAMIADVNRTARARALNTLHAIYGVGATLSPLLFGYLLDRKFPWRWALAGAALIWMLYALSAALFDRRQTAVQPTERSAKLDLSMLRSGSFMALAAIAFFYNGIAYSLLGWIALYMQESVGLSLFASVSMVSVFYVGLTGGRFLCAAIAEPIGYARMLLILAIGIAVTYPIVIFSERTWLVIIGILLTGLSLSGLFPMIMAYGTRLYPEQSGTLSGTLNVAMTLGAMIPPLWTGFIASIWTFQGALGVNYVMVIGLLLVAPYLLRLEQLHEEPYDPS